MARCRNGTRRVKYFLLLLISLPATSSKNFKLDHEFKILKILIKEQKKLKKQSKTHIIDRIIERRYDELKSNSKLVNKLYSRLLIK